MDVLQYQGLNGNGLAQLGTVQAGVSGQLPWSPGPGFGVGSNLGAGFRVQPRFHVGGYGQGMQDPAVNQRSGMSVPAAAGGVGLKGRLAVLAGLMRERGLG